ncbi:Hypothetical protein FKW44_015965 [Caligus rogercresseyi]|uniref:Uncharacterized protein n=1 Tax=Caligus rogercresseyi TaxID=217165 RepID=A0A7T8H112_CALRO|nr:Hypothetical protein FKW44_015965 [Caligus rogercresseyi]
MFTPCESWLSQCKASRSQPLDQLKLRNFFARRLNSLRRMTPSLTCGQDQVVHRALHLKPPHPARTSKTPARFRHTAEEEKGSWEH